jgi:hypothetical protein
MERNRMKKKERNSVGAPRGNQNARKHGFYAKVLTEAEQLDLEVASGIEGIDDEIDLLRVKIKSCLIEDPDNIAIILEATGALARLIKVKYNLDSRQGRGVRDAIIEVVKDLAIPMGIGVGVALK